MKRRWIKALSGLVIAMGLAAAVYAFTVLRPIAVEIARPEQNVAVRVFGLGTVEARIVSKVGFEVGAALTELTVDHGDSVLKGDVLARLHATEQEARVDRSRAAVLAAKVNVSKAEANVERAKAVLAQRQATNRRKQALVGDSIVSQETADEAKRDEDVAAAELAVAMTDVEVTKAQLADARAALTYEEAILAHHVLTAPFDAVVVERHREAGSVVKAGDVIFTLMAPETVWALAYVDEARAGGITEGQDALVRLRSLPNVVFRARVERIGIESDRVNEERRVWVKCQQCPPRVFLGEQAEVWIDVARLERALLVPEAAVSGFDGTRGRVWIVEDGRLARAELTFGHRTEDGRLEIVSGLPADARVVTAIVGGMREGRAATVAGDEGR